MTIFALQACGAAPSHNAPTSRLYGMPEPVKIVGYNGDAMEPFITRDGKFLLFNNSNDASVNTNLHYAVRVNDVTFQYKGEIANVNSSKLDGVATMDKFDNLYFVSLRSYEKNLSTIYHAKFLNGAASNVALVQGISQNKIGMVNFDVEVSADGNTLYFVDGKFSGSAVPDSADIVLARKVGDKFVRALNSAELLKQVNSTALEFAPSISADGLTLLFTRLYRGETPAIYITHRRSTTEPFDLPAQLEGLGDFVEAPTLSPNEKLLYFHRKVGDKFVVFKAQK